MGRKICRLVKAPPAAPGSGGGGRVLVPLAVFPEKAIWINGTTLNFYFFDRYSDASREKMANGKWDGSRTWRYYWNREKDEVRRAFETWKKVGIGLTFREVTTRQDADIRIGFRRRGHSWSLVGRTQIREENNKNKRTMNLDWDRGHDGKIDWELGRSTALHEIGHTLGLDHEHQNPKSNLEWHKNVAYAEYAKPPNKWEEEDVDYNILDKLSMSKVQGSNWDPDSIMHYEFESKLIKAPPPYDTTGTKLIKKLSANDKAWARHVYPAINNVGLARLRLGRSELLSVPVGKQIDFKVIPSNTGMFKFDTAGDYDTVMVLFEETSHVSDEWKQIAADDDSGKKRNAQIRKKLIRDRHYKIGVRLNHPKPDANKPNPKEPHLLWSRS